MKRFRLTSVVATVALLGGLLATGSTASAQTATYSVMVGGPIEGAPAESMRFLPDNLTVHQGDTINFAGFFHTATLLPANVGAQDWYEDNASNLGEPYYLLQPNIDDPANGAKLNLTAGLPSSTSCGTAEAPCPHDGTGVTNSGLFILGDPFAGFTVSIDAAPGDFVWVVCLAHPNMRMKIKVVEDDQPATSTEDAAADAAALLAKDEDTARALHAKLNKPSSHVDADGHKVWDAFAGYDTAHVSLFDMYPGKLTVQKGDTVRWHFAELTNEIHSVTFPFELALNTAFNDFVVSCDPDGPGGEPNTPPTMEAPPFCDDPSQLEILFQTQSVFPQGDGVFDGSDDDFENSGYRGALASPPAAGDEPYSLKFKKPSGKKGYKYICLVHPDMQGKVVVKQP